MEAGGNLHELNKFVSTKLPEQTLDPQVVLVFYNEKAVLEAEETPIPAVTAKKLKEFIRKNAKEKAMTMEQVEAIEDAIEGPLSEEELTQGEDKD
jgi:ribosomal protein L1